MMQVNHLSFRYTKKPFIQDMNFSVAEGEIFGFRGHPGQGRAPCRKSCWGCFQTTKAPPW